MQQVAALQEAGLLQVMPVGSGGKFGPAAHAENEVTTNETYCYNIKSDLYTSKKHGVWGKYWLSDLRTKLLTWNPSVDFGPAVERICGLVAGRVLNQVGDTPILQEQVLQVQGQWIEAPIHLHGHLQPVLQGKPYKKYTRLEIFILINVNLFI